jgi:monothiol glutaredoxin
MSDVQAKIKDMVDSNSVLLFMKGSRWFPQCGFSMRAASILNTAGVKYETFDILSDPEMRQGVKDFGNWPTFPQLYVKGKLVGGSDIMMEMYESGELQALLADLPREESQS